MYCKHYLLPCLEVCTLLKAPTVPSPPVPPRVSNGNTPGQVLTSTIAPVVCTIGLWKLLVMRRKKRERKLNLNPLSRLEALKPTHTASRIESDPHMNEQSEKMITNVKTLLVNNFTSKTTANVEDMVNFDIGAFTMKTGKGKGEMEPLEGEIEEAEEEIRRMKQVVANIENDVKCLKCYEEKCEAGLKSAQADLVKLATQLEAAKTLKKEIEQRKNAALLEIESIRKRLRDTL
ncbi:hypothetical protein K7X08_017309 [Anisodus acutangulus]|uniref:Uncharacterized protein n=1 Tax=Anisodus acutangulus TaxID=402998 RepID=A0A9Q1R9G5_9SOLA|nr:hypothetical protein K7X08_017309 [Anisodus acutangulus]